MKLSIKNMVCPRCILAVKGILDRLNIKYQEVRLGEAIIDGKLERNHLVNLKNELEALGFELLDDGEQQMIEKIKSIIIEYVHYRDENNTNISKILTTNLNKDYSYLSKLFSATEGINIEQYVILQKTERVKELLSYNQLTLSQISVDMGYSSVAHLSSQFKKVTGLTPTQFKSQGIRLRQTLDNINTEKVR